MRTIAIAFWGMVLTSPVCLAQLSVSPGWEERHGLTVASIQKVAVPTRVLRGFVTLKSVDAEPRDAIANLNAQKKAAMAALTAMDVPESSIKTTTTKILEWDKSPNVLNVYRTESDALVPTTGPRDCTAVAHLSFDIAVAGVDPDEMIILPFDILKRLESESVFESKRIHFLYVGEANDSQITEAKKKAYNEALAIAQATAAISGRTLGKLVALTPEVNGRWGYWSEPTYGYLNAQEASQNPVSNFRPAENEVFGTDPFNLSRDYGIELRFKIE
jgi:uncharacterized protein YggE